MPSSSFPTLHANPLSATPPSFIVGVGASAGGLEALEIFFSNMPIDANLGFVVVQHLSPDYKSMMVELLSKYTKMPVQEATDGQPVLSNHIYLIPRNNNLTIFHGMLHLNARTKQSQGLNLPIDIFLQSLAEDQGEKGIAIILSGTGSDGTRGVRALKEAGGMVMVQAEQSARFDGMPRSAIATQVVDYVLPPDEMPQELVRFTEDMHHGRVSPTVPKILTEEDRLNKIFAILRRQGGIDFAYYKRNTIVRRIERRMTINKYEHLTDYLDLLTRSPNEVRILRKEMLIGVTRFFRDPEAFEYLAESVIPEIIQRKKQHEKIRIWVAACSTGEEAFSLAMIVQDCLKAVKRTDLEVQLFATDIDDEALAFAGRGVFPESIAADIQAEWLQLYFDRRGDHYEVKRHIREMVIFAQQNLINDPPFSKIDLLSCRNVLIYFQPVLQKRVLELFYFALVEGGYLFLGSSETLGDDFEALQPINQRWRIYQMQEKTRPRLQQGKHLDYTSTPVPTMRSRRFAPAGRNDTHLRQEIELYRQMIESSLPPSVIVDRELNLVHAFGDLSLFLSVPTGGRVTLNLPQMVTDALSIPLSTAVHKALKEDRTVIYRFVHLTLHENEIIIDLIARPLTNSKTREKMVVISFETVSETIPDALQMLHTAVESDETFDREQNAGQRIHDLENALQFNRENLQATNEELETSNEELQSTNEELLAANEELQSTNEELESVNEELITVNAEYQEKIRELTDLSDDVSNLLSSTDIGTIFLDKNLRIRKYTPTIQREISLLEHDIGRPLSHIAHRFVAYDLVTEAQKVLDTLQGQTDEVQNMQGDWYLVKIFPYRTLKNIVKGVVISFVDITELKRTIEKLSATTTALQESEDRFRAALQFSRMGIYHQDKDLYYTWAYNPYPRFPGFDSQTVLGQTDYSLFLAEDAEYLTQLKQEVMESGLGVHEEINVAIYNERVVFDLTIEPRYDHDGNLLGLTCAMLEVSDRRSYAILQSLMHHLNLGVFVKQVNGHYLYGSRQFRTLLGLSPDKELFNQSDADLFPEEIAAPLTKLTSNLAETDEKQQVFLHGRGLTITLFTVENNQGVLYGYCGLVEKSDGSEQEARSKK